MADFFDFKAGNLGAELKRFEAKVKRAMIDSKHGIKNAQLNEVATIGVIEMKDRIQRGQSPIKGRGRFPAYKNPKKYPGKRKPKRPVNLYLSGVFLKALRGIGYRVGQEIYVRIGFSDSLNAEKERGHREGANGQPKRPIIPEGNETFTPRILLKMKKAYKLAYKEALKRRKKE